MKNSIRLLSLVLVMSSASASAEMVFRPYATCVSSNGNTTIEIKQNTDSADQERPFQFDVVRTFRGNSVTMNDKYAVKVPVQRKDVMELFQSKPLKNAYFFELVITHEAPSTMIGTFKSYFMDILGRTVVYCSHHVTLGAQ